MHASLVNYFTDSDIQALRGEKRPLANKIQVVVDRFVRLGLNSPDEWTIAWSVGVVILSHYTTFPLYQSVKGTVDDMRDIFKASQKA